MSIQQIFDPYHMEKILTNNDHPNTLHKAVKIQP